MSRNFTIGIVQSVSQDTLLQTQVSTAVGNAGCWSGAYAPAASADYIWTTGTGASDTRSNGVKISNGGTPITTLISGSAQLNYVPGAAPFGGRWSSVLSDIGDLATTAYGCTVCVVSACNTADNDHNTKGLVINSKTCNGRGVMRGDYPACRCDCNEGWTGGLCTIRSITRSLSASNSLSQSPVETRSATNTKTTPHTSTPSITTTDSLSSTHTYASSPTTSITSTDSLPSTRTYTLPPTKSIASTDSLPLTHTYALSRTKTTTITDSALRTASKTVPTTSTETMSSSAPTTQTTAITAATPTTSRSQSTSISRSPTGSPSVGSLTRSSSGSLSESSTSECGIVKRMAGDPGLCILLNTTGRDDGVECGNATLASAPVATAHVGAGDTAVLTISPDVWSTGAVVAAAVHLALPLRMQDSWGGALSVGPDGLVEMSSFVTETSRSGTGRVLGSTSVRFYRLGGRRSVNGTWAALPPTNTSDGGAGRAEVAELLRGSPEGRLGMVIAYNGPRGDRFVPTDDSDVQYEMPSTSMACGDEVGSLRFGVRLSGRANFASAVSEASGQALDVLQTIGTVTAMLTLLPTVVLQLGVQGSIREMAECQGWWIDMEEDGVGSYRLANLMWLSGTKLQQLSSPYGMGVASLGATGHEWVAGRTTSNTSNLIQTARERAVSELESMGQYYRGAIMTSLINLCVFSTIVAVAVCAVFGARHVAKVDNPHASRSQNILDAAALVQVPSVFMVGLSLLMDGLTEGSTTLMSIRVQFAAEPDGYASVFRTTALEAGVPGQTMMSGIDGYMTVPGWAAAGLSDILLCMVALALMTGFILHVLYVVTGKRLAVVVVPMEHMVMAIGPASSTDKPQATAGEDDLDDELLGKSNTEDDAMSVAEDSTPPTPHPPVSPPGRWKALWLYWFELREHWVPPGDELASDQAYEAGVSWMRKYGMYVGGTKWAPYTVMELSIAFVVTGLEGVVSSNTTWCAVKCAVAVVLLCVQLAALLVLKPLSARFDHILTTASVLLSLCVGILITVNIIVQDAAIAIAADMLTVFASLTVTVFGIVGAINGVVAIVDVVRTVLEALKNRRAREAREAEQAAEEELQLPEIDDDVLPPHLYDSGLGDAPGNDGDMEPPGPTEEEERELWDGYLRDLENGPVQPPDEEGEAMCDAILPPDVLPGDDNSKEPDPSLELLTDVLAVGYEEEGEDWDAFLRDLDREEQDI